MTSRKVIDSFGILTFLENGEGSEKIANLFKQARDTEKPLLISVVNFAEVYWAVREAAGTEAAERATENIKTLPIEIVPVDDEFAIAACELRTETSLSYSDCFAAALAKIRKADLVTSVKDFKEVEGRVKIMWV